MSRNENIVAWRLIAACQKATTLSEAAETAGIDLPAASRTISAFERELGIRLLDRSHKPALFTDALVMLSNKAARLIKAHTDLMLTARNLADTVVNAASSRTVRISIPINMSRQGIFNALLDYDRRHGGITLDICADSGPESLASGRTDIGFFGYEPAETDFFVVPVTVNRNFLMASSKYAAMHGLPETVSDIAKHRLLMRNRANRSFRRILVRDEETYLIGEQQKIAYGDAETCRSMLLASEGIAVDLDLGFMSAELANGTVVPVLPGWTREPWKDCLACRTEDARDPLIREIMALVKKAAFSSFMERWDFWYKRFGIACPDTFRKL